MLDIKVFGIAEVRYNNAKINFPFKKAEGVFYYLFVNGSSTRDELINLFWGDTSDNIARKNLRNAIYRIKKEINSDIILSPQKNTLIFNRDILGASDFDELFYPSKDVSKISSEEFLKGFYIKGSTYFEDWIYEIRERCQREKIKKLKLYVDLLKDEDEKINIFEKILEIDALDEEIYSKLIKSYSKLGKYHKAIKIFHKLKNVLSDELGVEPDEEISKFVQNLMFDRKREKNISESVIIGRLNEKNEILEQIKAFKLGYEYKNIIISGEAGIGKTTLFCEIFNSNIEVLKLKSECYKVDKDFYLKSWSEILNDISNFIIKNNIYIEPSLVMPLRRIFPNFDLDLKESSKDISNYKLNDEDININILNNTIEEVLKQIILKICEHNKIIMFFEDIHWMDEQSVSLLMRLIHDLQDKIMFIATLRSEESDNLNFLISKFKEKNILKIVNLSGFTKAETEQFISKFNISNIASNVKDKIYRESEGNPFFISEYLKMIKENNKIEGINSKIASILESRFSGLSKSSRQILNIMSVFSRDVRFDRLLDISNKDELELLELLSELRNKYLIKEKLGTNSFVFTHSKLKEYAYDSLNNSFKRIIHKKIGDIIERDYKSNNFNKGVDMLSDLIFHYKSSDEKFKMLNYKLDYISYYLDYVHELYPMLKNKNMSKKLRILNRESVLLEFKEIDKLFSEVKEIYNSSLINTQNAKYLYIKGRYFIRNGEYFEGKKYIEEQILLSNALDEKINAIKGYKQLIFMTIQKHDIINMRKYLDKAIELEKDVKNLYQRGVLYRLNGLYYLMLGNYNTARESFLKSIEVFDSDILNKRKYLLNIAACYNYLGEIYRRNHKYDLAIKDFTKAINICESNGIDRGIEIFYTNLAQTNINMGKIRESHDVLKKAVKYYDLNGTIWHKSVADAYLSYIEFLNKNFEKSSKYLKRALILSEQLKNPYDLGLVKYIQYKISKDFRGNFALDEVFKADKETLKEAIKLFKEANAEFEIENLV